VIDLPGTTPGTDWERFRAKARAYLAEHEDHLALQRLRRNQPLTTTDLEQLEEMLLASGAGHADDIARAREESQGLGLFVRSLVGLDRSAATEALSRFLDDSTYSRAQIDFVGLIVSELTANGVMAARRLYESPFTDNAPSGPDYFFGDADVDAIIVVLDQVRANAAPDYRVADV
jgi:type I restriction enzyme R subunit